MESINFLDIIEESPKGIITLRASNQTNNNFLLVKFIEVIRNSNETWENTPRMLPILAEIKLLESISKNQNPSFLELLSFFEENPKPNKKVFIIIMEYGLASLKEVLEIKKEFTQDEIIAIIFPFIKAFLSIQTNEGICHRNLTPESLILNSTNNDFSYKILDFGFGWSVKNSEGNQIKADTINSFSWVYSAPEILNFIELDNKEGKYDGFKADVYSLGIIIMLMMGCDLENLMSKEGKNACFLEKQKKYPQLCELVKKMISENPNMRSSWEEVQSDFLKLKVTIYKEDRLTIENLKKPISNEEIIVNNERIIKLLREKLNRPELCYKYCDKILEYISKKSSNNNNYIKEAELYTLYGNLCLEARDGEKSLDLHEKSLEKLQSFGTQDKEKLAANFYGIGLAYYQMEKYNDSLNFQEKVLEVIAKNNIESLINSYIEISKCLRELKNYSKSVYFLAKALNICNKKYGENNKLSLKILNLHGALYKKKREYKISYEYYEKALKICKNLDPQSLEMAESMDNISLICKALGDLKNALEFRKEALTIKEKYYEEVSPEMAFSFNNLANIYKELKEFNSAIEFHEKALNIKIRLYGEKSLEAAISMNNLGNVYMMLNNFKRALEYHEKAYVIRTELLGKEDLDVAISLNNLGEVYQSILQFQKALEIHMKALEIRNKIEGSESYNIALSLYNIGVSYQGLKKYDKSLEYIHKAWEQFKKLLRGANEETKKCLEKLIDIYNTLGDKINYNRFKEILSKI